MRTQRGLHLGHHCNCSEIRDNINRVDYFSELTQVDKFGVPDNGSSGPYCRQAARNWAWDPKRNFQARKLKLNEESGGQSLHEDIQLNAGGVHQCTDNTQAGSFRK